MRDIERIEKILYQIGKLWVKHPDYRFGQLLINYGLAPDTPSFWRAEDDDLLEALKRIQYETEI
jgi:hypothetical protein